MFTIFILGGDARIRTEKDLLYIHDMNYDDRQRYKCLGIGGGNKTLLQTISLNVKGRYREIFFKTCALKLPSVELKFQKLCL